MDRLASLEVLVAIVDHGGFGRAAERLGMSATMVSTHIARLEDRLGAQLIHRSTRRFVLTPQGHLLVEEARLILESIERAENSVRHGGAGPSGRVSIDMPSAIGLQFVVPLMPLFRALHPQVALDLHVGDRSNIFRPDGFDMLIRIGATPEGKSETIKLGQTRFVQVASPAYLARQGTPVTLEELQDHDTILYTTVERPVGQWRFIKGEESRSLRLRSVASFNHGDAITAAAVAGVGIAQTLEMLVAAEFSAGTLVPILTDWNQASIDVQLVIPHDRVERAAVRATADFLIANMNWPGRLR